MCKEMTLQERFISWDAFSDLEFQTIVNPWIGAELILRMAINQAKRLLSFFVFEQLI